MNCIFAKRFTAWVSDIAAPVVRAHTGEALIAIVTGSSFECRNRNGDTTAKISEHASGNAIDIAAFRLADKESLPVANVQKTEDVESRWLMALRISAEIVRFHLHADMSDLRPTCKTKNLGLSLLAMRCSTTACA